LLQPAAPQSLTVLEAFGINDYGQIVGNAKDGTGNWHAVILTPRNR
jgi:hypothetical protein